MREVFAPEEIEETTFSTTLRGYDKNEVETFLGNVAEAMRLAVQEAHDKAYQNLGETMGDLLQHAKESADQLIKEARDTGAGIRQEAQEEASLMLREAERSAEQTREAAHADGTRREQEADRSVRELQEEEEGTRVRIRELRMGLADLVVQLHDLEEAPALQNDDQEVAIEEEFDPSIDLIPVAQETAK